MEHIRQSSQKHASGSLYVTEDLAGLRPTANLQTIFGFPFPDGHKKPAPLSLTLNRGHLKKDFSQLSSIRRLGECPAPRQPLPLDVDETALDRDTRPELVQNVYHVGVTVHCKATRAQSVPDKAIKERRELGLGVFRDGVLPGHNLALLSIHQGNKAAWAVKESAVQYQMLALSQAQQGLRRSLFQIVVNHTIKFCRAMFTLARQLSDRITFGNPESEPLSFSCAPCRGIAPAKGLPAVRTKPALLPISIMTISLQNFGTARAVFFCSN